MGTWQLEMYDQWQTRILWVCFSLSLSLSPCGKFDTNSTATGGYASSEYQQMVHVCPRTAEYSYAQEATRENVQCELS